MTLVNNFSTTVWRYYQKLRSLAPGSRQSAIIIEADFRNPKTISEVDFRNPKTITETSFRNPKTITEADFEGITAI